MLQDWDIETQGRLMPLFAISTIFGRVKTP